MQQFFIVVICVIFVRYHVLILYFHVYNTLTLSYIGDSEALPLRSFVKTLLRSPVYYLRQLSAAAYVSLVPQKITVNTVQELLSELKQSNESNFIHGALVSVEMLINSCNEYVGYLIKDNTKLHVNNLVNYQFQ